MTEHTERTGAATAGRTPRWAGAWALVRIGMAVLLASAVVAQFRSTVRHAATLPEPYASHLPTVIANFFSYFTIESNLATALVLAVAAIGTWTSARWGRREPAWLAVLFACVTTYMLTTSVVYNILLRGTEDPDTTVWWSNEVMHVWGAIFLLADALLAPGRRRLPWRALWAVIAFPVLWAAYTLVRANVIISPATGRDYWYPYPFLDPHLQGGYGGVVPYILAIAVGVGLLGALVLAIGRLRDRATEAVGTGR